MSGKRTALWAATIMSSVTIGGSACAADISVAREGYLYSERSVRFLDHELFWTKRHHYRQVERQPVIVERRTIVTRPTIVERRIVVERPLIERYVVFEEPSVYLRPTIVAPSPRGIDVAPVPWDQTEVIVDDPF